MSPRAFVIMPFSPEFDQVFRHIIQPALTGYDVSRADSRLDERGILEKIVTGIDEADLVIADITSTNANVMYELGVAHALNKPTVMIAQSVNQLPFDVRAYPVHEYSYETNDAIAAHLAGVADLHRKGLLLFANPVSDFLPHVAVLTRVEATSVRARTEEEVAEQINARADEIGATAVAIGLFFHDFHELTGRYTQGLMRTIADVRAGAGIPNDNAGIREAARLTRQFAVELDSLSTRLHDIWERIGRATLWLVSDEQRPYITLDQARKFAAGAEGMDEHLDSTLAELAELRRVNGSFPDWSGSLTHALEVANSAVSRHINEIMTAKSYVARIAATVSGSA
jgi:nucleoside 2-deoxyribosyltransferase